LSSLVDKSMVVVSERHGVGRYSMLETVRAYAGEKLATRDETEPTNSRHTAWIVRLAWEWFAHARASPGQDIRQYGELPGELDNLRVAHDRALADREPSTALGLGASLAGLIVNEIPSEALSRCERALALDGGDPFLRSQCHLMAAIAASYHMRSPWEHIALSRALVEENGLAEDAVLNIETMLASLLDAPGDVPFSQRLDDYKARMPDGLPEGIRDSEVASLAARRAVADGDLEAGLHLANDALTALRDLDGRSVFNAAWGTAYAAWIRTALGHPDALTEADERTIEHGRDIGLRVLLDQLRIVRALLARRPPDTEVDAVVSDARRVGWTEAAVRRPIAAMTTAHRPDLDVRVALPLLASAREWDFGVMATAREALRRRGEGELASDEFDRLVTDGAALTTDKANALAAAIIRQATRLTTA